MSKKRKIIIFATIVLLILLGTLYKNKSIQNNYILYQEDTDLLRLEHLEYWSGLIEEYYTKTGKYPLYDSLLLKNNIILVRIGTKEHQKYFTKTSDKYNPKLDNNSDGFFSEFNIKDLVSELEKELGRNIDEKYDIQKIPTTSPIWYNYFLTEKGYLIWTSCITCGVTPISTLLIDGYTPTVNIASEGMIKEITKAFTRKDMINNKIYKSWKKRGYNKEDYIRMLEEKNFNDSKIVDI